MRSLRIMSLIIAVFSSYIISATFGQSIKPNDLNFQEIAPRILEQRLKSAPRNNEERAKTLRAMFRAAGCGSTDLAEQLVHKGKPPNIICKLPGETSGLIIVGAHLDHVRRGDGIVDDWSGASLLPSLYQSLRPQSRRHTFLFIGFTEEEKGRRGSKFYVKTLASGFVRRIRAMVNLECLGMNPPEVWADHAAPALLAALDRVAQAMGTYFPRVDLERVGYDDAVSFRHRNVPTITIHSLSQDKLRVLHSPQDNLSAEHLNDYDDSFRLIAAYLAYLDRVLP